MSRSGTPRQSGDETSNLPVTSQPALRPEPHTAPTRPQSHDHTQTLDLLQGASCLWRRSGVCEAADSEDFVRKAGYVSLIHVCFVVQQVHRL